MKRDMDLVRAILLAVESQPDQPGWVDVEIEGYPAEAVVYHVRLLDEAGLIEAVDLTTHGGIDWRPKRLTWAGHEFLDLARNDKVWKKAMASLSKVGVKVSLPLLQKLLADAATDLLGLAP